MVMKDVELMQHEAASTQVNGNGSVGNIQVTHLTLCTLVLFLMPSLFGLLSIGDICLHSVTVTVIEISYVIFMLQKVYVDAEIFSEA